MKRTNRRRRCSRKRSTSAEVVNLLVVVKLENRLFGSGNL
jgi:hypothetical protein